MDWWWHRRVGWLRKMKWCCSGPLCWSDSEWLLATSRPPYCNGPLQLKQGACRKRSLDSGRLCRGMMWAYEGRLIKEDEDFFLFFFFLGGGGGEEAVMLLVITSNRGQGKKSLASGALCRGGCWHWRVGWLKKIGAVLAPLTDPQTVSSH